MQAKIISSLEKCFPDESSGQKSALEQITMLRNERYSFQVCYDFEELIDDKQIVYFSVESPLSDYIQIYKVKCIPSLLPVYRKRHDAHYLRTEPGLFPDLLEPMGKGDRLPASNILNALWLEVDPQEHLDAGIYPLTCVFTDTNGEKVAEVSTEIEIIGASLPPQELIFTQWFYTDCLMQYYGVDAFDEQHWQIIENFMANAKRYGMNMILTPVLTPELDTYVGGERPTTQLVGITLENGIYSFDFSNLGRWVDLCDKVGIQYLEINHFFTQWGAAACPKVIATVDGKEKRIFGWDDIATDAPYREFLACFLPQLVEKLKEWGIADHCRFHIKDEPHVTFRETYKAEKAQVEPYIPGFKIMDAMSHFDYVESGVIKCPVPIVDCAELDKFREACKGDYWLYYCCGPEDTYTNRFFAQPSYRTRILGTQLYVENAQGFLHWGYNFYNSERSRKHINPFCVTDGYEAFPSGDAFIVYPGEDQKPQESIRYMLMRQAMYDLRAMQLLESKIGREAVEAIINENVDSKLTLANYPRTNAYLPTLRDKINREIEKFC